MIRSFKAAVQVKTLAALPNATQLGGLGSVVAAAFVVCLPLGLLVLGAALMFVGWVIR